MGAQMSLVVPNLYLGSWQGANNAKLLDEKGVRRILTIFDVNYPMPECVRQRDHLHLVAADSCQQDIRKFFSQANDFIHSGRVSGEAVFVHCMAGVSRSATLTVVYLASVTDLPWDTVLRAVRAAKHDVAPNFHFRAQMRLWQTDGGLEAERARLAEKFGHWDFQLTDRERLLALAEVCADFERTGYWRGEPRLERRGNSYFAVHHLPDGEGEGEEDEGKAEAEASDEAPEVAEEAREVAESPPDPAVAAPERWAEKVTAAALDHQHQNGQHLQLRLRAPLASTEDEEAPVDVSVVEAAGDAALVEAVECQP